MQSVAEAILQNGAGAIGPGQPMPIAGLQTVAFTLSGVFVATVTFEATTVEDPQPGDWYPLNAHQSGTVIIGTTGTGPGIYRASIAGLTWVRARVSSWTSGAVTVNGKAVAVDDNSKLVNANITGRIQIDTLLNAASVPAVGGIVTTTFSITTEAEIWLLVNIDQQPWIMTTGSALALSSFLGNTCYPDRGSAQATAYATAPSPATSLWLGHAVYSGSGLTAPASMQEAKAIASLVNGLTNVALKVTNNHATLPATATVKIARVWR